MSTPTPLHSLLTTALHGAADVARTRLQRTLDVVDAPPTDSTALLRFDLSFADGALLSWLVSNEDATGLADLLIGGHGDRAAVLTEMHLDALSGMFSDMLERMVESLNAELTMPLAAGGVDMGMESGIPQLDAGGDQIAMALQIEGFGKLGIVQQVNPSMAAMLGRALPATAAAPEMAAPAVPTASAAPGATEPLHADDAPMPAGPGAPVTAPSTNPLDNVVSLPDRAHPAAATNVRRGDLGMLMNVPLPLTVELGRTERTIRDLVEMNVGSIIELGKLAGDPLEIMVNDRVIARGEVVVIDEAFGIRVTEISSAEDRIRSLG